jgi:tetratricopeptide (TPR) repeat protein
MTIQQRRRRRLAVIAFVLLVAGGALAGMYAHRQQQVETASRKHRADGLAAAVERNSAVALDELGAYLRRHDDDVEALYQYALARRAIEAPRGRHLTQAIGVLQRIVELAPDHAEARRELLDLYSTCGYNHETIDLADTILAGNAGEANAWRAKAVALARMRQFPGAHEAAQRCLALRPFDVRASVLLLDVRQQQGAPGTELVESAKAHRRQFPQSPIADLQEAYANRLAGNVVASLELLRAAATRPAADEDYLVMLVMLLDDARLSEESMAMLEKASSATASDSVRVELTRRLWEAGRYKEIDQRLAGLDAARRDSNDVLLGLRAAALFELGRRDEAQAIRVALASRGADSVGAAWAGVLGAAYGPRQGQAQATIAACTEALVSDPGNAYFAYLQGAAWWSLGETDLAQTSWKAAIKHRPGWLTPRIGYVYALLAAGQSELAQREARLAIERAPQRVDVIAAWVVAHASTLSRGDAERAAQILPAAAAVQRAAPFEPRTLPLYIALQAQTGKPEVAADRLRQVLAKAPALDEATWLQLAAVSQDYGLKLENECYEQVRKRAGETPGLSLARAIDLASKGQAEAGKRLLVKAAASPKERHALAWQVALGKFLDHTGDPGALALWLQLADAHADDARVQGWALQTRCVKSDGPAQDRLIERLRALSGPQAVTWRLARAQRLLAGDGGRGAAEAAALLQGVVADAPHSLSAQVMLARSLDRMNLDAKAAAQITAAARVQPQSVELAMEAARMLQSQQDYAGARTHLLRVAARGDLDPPTAARLAAMLARQGEDAAALGVLDSMARTTPLSEHQLLLMGALGRRQGDGKRVDAVVAKLLESPSAAGIEFAADYYATIGEVGQARNVLARLDAAAMSKVDRATILATFEQRHGTPGSAVALWEQAVAADPSAVAPRRSLIAQQLRARETAQALASLDATKEALPSDEGITDLWRRKNVIVWAAGKPLVQPLLLAMVLNGSAQAVTGEALEVIKEMRPEDRTAGLARLRALALANPGELPLLTVTVQLQLMYGRAEDAVVVSGAALAAQPTAWEAAWVRSEALGAAGRWDEALAAAQEWRRRSVGDTLPADMMIAEALHRLNRAGEAASQLAAYLPRARSKPGVHGDLLWSYARSQLVLGRVDAAVALLSPFWKEAGTLRSRSIDLALQTGVSSSSAMSWLDRLAVELPGDAAAERTRLAATWLDLASRFQSAECRRRASQLLAELLKAPAASAEQWFLEGMLEEQEGNVPRAELAYRKALELSPALAAACNNLAMLLAARDTQLDEALDLATRAARSAPQSPGYLDTLAHVQHRLNRTAEAVATARRAVELQPENPQWRARLASLLAPVGTAPD